MTPDHEHPQHGGSYRRNDDGSLTLVDAAPATPIAESPADQHPKPARTSRNKDK